MDWTRYIADNVLIFMVAYNEANCYTATVCVPLKCNSVLKYQGPVVCCKLLALINSGYVWTGLGMQQTMWAYFCSSIVAHSKANCYTVTACMVGSYILKYRGPVYTGLLQCVIIGRWWKCMDWTRYVADNVPIFVMVSYNKTN